MSYIIRRTDGAYVAANAGITGASYTDKLQRAQVYGTKEAAERERCPGNEVVIDLSDVMPGGGQCD